MGIMESKKFALFGVSWVSGNSVRDVLMVWQIMGLDKRRMQIWGAVHFCLFFVVWKQRNDIAIEEGKLNVQRWNV